MSKSESNESNDNYVIRKIRITNTYLKPVSSS